ncbi:unnamed protein product [Owenia fusiformis]|uniref:Uncharacterized protein n=1 Tax=Owenia fusiformis TaxID=6347 RepID=A0A8J1UW64_OWEFU|nr:unnamed protein product [Owenia fusiformis]
MAFQAPSAVQGSANRKILEELQEQKKRLKMQTVQPISGANQAQNIAPSNNGNDNQTMTPAQRAALQHAHANSVGYFITQDSSFGNLILPVIPRIDKPPS